MARVSYRGVSSSSVSDGRERDIDHSQRRVARRYGCRGRGGQLRARRGTRHRGRPASHGQQQHAIHQLPDNSSVASWTATSSPILRRRS